MVDSSKAIQKCEIPVKKILLICLFLLILVKIIKGNSDLFAEVICKFFNESLEESKFYDCLKLANVTPIFEKGARTSENNCRPVSILLLLSNLFELLISKQLSEFFESILVKFQCGFRKDYGSHNCPLMML